VSEPELNIRDKRPEDQCVDEMTLLLYAERQLDREAAQGVSLHTQTCTRCLTLLRALDRESRLLTRSMLEQDEPLPARLAEFQAQVKRNMQWIWGVIFGLAVLGVYALYTGYIEPWERQFEQAGFGGSNLLSLVVFQGAFWKGWQSMFSLVEVFAVVTMVGFGLFAFRRFLRRGSAMAVLFTGLGLLVAMAPAASATEFRKGDSVTVKKDEVIKGDLFVTGKHVRIEGEVDGDVYAFAEQVDVTGRINGDLIGFVQTERITGVIDGNLRTAANNVTITGTVERSVLTWNQVFNLDSGGKIGRSLTAGGQTLTVDGKVDGDFLSFSESTSISGFIGGSVKGRGKSLSIGSGAEIDGKTVFYGEQPPSVASDAKLGSSPEFTKAEHHAHERDAGYYVWRIIWTGAVILFGLVLAGVMPKFAKETVESGGHLGASFGLGVLVFFGVLFASILACVTIVGLLVGLSSLMLWFVMLFAAEIVVGGIVGQWIMGQAEEFWPFFLRVVVGVVAVRIVTSIPFIGFWAGLIATIWGMGAISLAIYRRLQPTLAPNIPSMPLPPLNSPLPPHTTVGGI
jgi:cytoskeletal protein CcmA (bactofilin family)